MGFPFYGIICIIIHVRLHLGAYDFAKVFWDKTLVAVQKIKSFILYLGGWKDGKREEEIKELFPEWEQTYGCLDSTVLLVLMLSLLQKLFQQQHLQFELQLHIPGCVG